jgi:putative membrane protein
MDNWRQVMGRWNTFFPLRGAIAGAIGTVPMTLFMLAMHRLLPNWQRYALPPEEITHEAAERAHVREHMTKEQVLGATLVSHLGYGASMGSLYSAFTEQFSVSTPIKGAVFGLVVWAGSYLGWLPAANFPVAAPEEPIRRNTMMIIAHLIWGATTAITDNLMKEDAVKG